MKSREEIEKVLQRFGDAWPAGASIVDGVMREIHSTPARPVVSIRRRIIVKSLLSIAASLVACVALWCVVEGNRNPLYAQVLDAARRARTIRITHYGQPSGNAKPRKIAENWYEKGVGFRRDVYDWKREDGQCVTICLGHGDDVWTLDSDRQKTIIHSRRGITKETEQIFADFDRGAQGLQNHVNRYPEADQALDGQPCKAYLPKTSASDKQRELIYLDEQTRVVRVMKQQRVGDRWKTTTFSAVAYDEPFDRTLFQPNFGKDFKILEADAKPADSTPKNPEGPTLVYEVDRRFTPDAAKNVDVDRLLDVVNARLNGGAEKLATVRKLNDRRLEVTLLRKSDADRRRVERQLTRPGTLEFRVLANNQTDKALIDDAQKDANTDLVDSSGKRLAWWVPVRVGVEKSFTSPQDIARRTEKADNHNVTEILVVADPYNVTGAYLAEAKLHFRPFGDPAVSFTFNEAGGELFSTLTAKYASDGPTGSLHRLGIIVDGELIAAPVVRGKIGSTGDITGGFNEIEVSDIVAALNAGSLPVRLRLFEGNGPSPQPK